MHAGVLDTIGRTPLAALRRMVRPGMARVLVKLENRNPSGSVKDRVALAVAFVMQIDFAGLDPRHCEPPPAE